MNGFSGTVERIGHATTTLRASNGRTYIIPNAYFLEHVVEKEDPPNGESRRPLNEATGGFRAHLPGQHDFAA